jgi:hypothetical protein
VKRFVLPEEDFPAKNIRICHLETTITTGWTRSSKAGKPATSSATAVHSPRRSWSVRWPTALPASGLSGTPRLSNSKTLKPTNSSAATTARAGKSQVWADPRLSSLKVQSIREPNDGLPRGLFRTAAAIVETPAPNVILTATGLLGHDSTVEVFDVLGDGKACSSSAKLEAGVFPIFPTKVRRATDHQLIWSSAR